jgi:predicted aspartyl protease
MKKRRQAGSIQWYAKRSRLDYASHQSSSTLDFKQSSKTLIVWLRGAMETATMRKVLVAARLENLEDIYKAAQGTIPHDQVRSCEVTDALIDTGATGLLLPSRMIAQLGLSVLRTRTARPIAGNVDVSMYRAVRLTVQGRDCISDVGEIGDEFAVVMGQVPLELMDWVVDPKRQRLMGNPEHGGDQMIDVI